MRKILYKKYIKEKDALKIESQLVIILYSKYYEGLDSSNGLILRINDVPYLQGIADMASISGNSFKNLKEEVDNLITYIFKHKEVNVWSCFENE